MLERSEAEPLGLQVHLLQTKTFWKGIPRSFSDYNFWNSMWRCFLVLFSVYMLSSLKGHIMVCKSSLHDTMLNDYFPIWHKYKVNSWIDVAVTRMCIEYRIVCCIKTYLIHIYHMSKCNLNRYIEGCCMWNVHFYINGLSPNIAYAILMSWTLMAIYFLYWIIDYFLCSFHIIFNGNK